MILIALSMCSIVMLIFKFQSGDPVPYCCDVHGSQPILSYAKLKKKKSLMLFRFLFCNAILRYVLILPLDISVNKKPRKLNFVYISLSSDLQEEFFL